jgi:hypothetical protein
MSRIVTAVVLAFALGSSACVVHRHHSHPVRSHRHAITQPTCKPSQYWDGHKCRHKGKGHGARKHDSR